MRFLALSPSNRPGWSAVLVISTLVCATAHANTFTDIDADLTGVLGCVVTWCDYDNDGDLDVLIAGESGPFELITKIYRNDGNEIFTDTNANLAGFAAASVAWGDYDNDGDPDILITGEIGPLVVATAIYRNDGNSTFTNTNATLPGVLRGSVAWGDYDNDGDLDIVLSGAVSSGDIARVYRNDGNGIFADMVDAPQTAGHYEVHWNGTDQTGNYLPSGVYFCRLEAETFVQNRKLLVIK